MPQVFKHDKPLPKYLIPNVKKCKFFIFLKDRYFVTGGPIHINFGESNANLNVESRAKFNCLYKVDRLF